jgi:acetylornithine deacetylase/succinyl-diaminopimelate desuccinylase-like protein
MQDHIVTILRELVAINSINTTLSGGAGEKEIAGFIRSYMSQLGFDAQVQTVSGERVNVVALVRGKSPGSPVLLNGHIDTVGVEGMLSPFTLRQEGDRLYGRGAYDMKGSVAVMLALAGFWARHPPERDVWLTFSCDEEDRSLGTEFMVKQWLPTLPVLPGGAIFLEPTEENIGVAHKGFTWFEIEVLGKAAHGSRPEQGVDAILPLRAALDELQRIRSELRSRPPDALLGHASLHGGKIEGGTELSVVPAHARLQWERRTLPDEKPEMVEAEHGRVAQAVEQLPGGHRVKSRKIFMRPPYRTPNGADLLRRIQTASSRSSLVGLSFWADSALMGLAGIPSVLYGPIGHGAHAIDEWVSCRSLLNVCEVLKKVFSPDK